jgi:hypothetical protein
MRDTLDLPQLVQQGNEMRRTARRRNQRTLILLVFTLIVLGLTRAFLNAPLGRLYVGRGDTFKTVELPSGVAPEQVSSTSDGAIWVLPVNENAVYRYDGTAWTEYVRSDFNSEDRCLQEMTTYDREVWLVRCRDITRFDSSRWINYPKAMPSPYVHSIVAGSWGVFMADYYGEIAFFDGKLWSSQAARNMLPGFVGGEVDYYPSMKVTPDGRLILVYYGIWQFDGVKWTQLAEDSDVVGPRTTLLAADVSKIWFSTSTGLRMLDLATNKTRYPGV